ncbi:MAG: hypothetical protein KAR84_03110 [Elusimicrobiales bacterium]|nr:hypothetical protein [Elusimicrobiales bacterium]MCK5357898.1 hypothetical protein [Elusimicrobiales bacterium]MCK5584075.1 hypothetical protein [Elusimicrobiales bacterium]
MENKIKIMQKVLTIIVFLAMFSWLATVHGFSIITGIMALLVIAVFFSSKKQKNSVDERDRQIHYVSTYGAYFVTLCFLFVYQTAEYLISGKQNPLAILTIIVLSLSQWSFTMFLKGKKIKGEENGK